MKAEGVGLNLLEVVGVETLDLLLLLQLLVCSGFKIQGSGCRVQVSGFRVQGTGFRFQVSGCRFQGTGYRVEPLDLLLLLQLLVCFQ